VLGWEAAATDANGSLQGLTGVPGVVSTARVAANDTAAAPGVASIVLVDATGGGPPLARQRPQLTCLGWCG
jgi:hypothetical protein